MSADSCNNKCAVGGPFMNKKLGCRNKIKAVEKYFVFSVDLLLLVGDIIRENC